MARESAVRVGLVYPELLGTYGDRGNALVLAQRCHWRDQAAEVVEIAAGEPIPDSLDVYLFGGGEDAPQAMAASGMSVSAMLIVGLTRITSNRYQSIVNATTRKIIIGNASVSWS